MGTSHSRREVNKRRRRGRSSKRGGNCSLCPAFHKMTTVHKSLKFCRALRKTVWNTIIKENNTKSYIFKKNKRKKQHKRSL